MRYKKFDPTKDLQPFVECYFVWEGEAKDRVEVQSPPNCFSAIVFNYGDPTWAHQNSDELSLVPNAFVCGIFTSNYHRVLKGAIGMVGIVFKATSIHNFFGMRASHLVNSRLPLQLLIGDEADQMLAEIEKGVNDESRIKVLEKFIESRHIEAKGKLSIIDEAVEYIDQYKGIISVDEVATHLKISRRYLEKQFLEKVGVSPKFYSRIKRFGFLSNKIAHSEKIDWQDVVFENGFHDQSHLIRDFLEFNKMNPSEYHQKHREMTRFI